MRAASGKWTQAIGAAAVVFAVSAGSGPSGARRAAAQAGSSVWSGVYTEEQAKRGEAVSNKLCTSCHGPELSGGEAGPTLVGLEFLGNWNNLTVADFYDRVHATMPADAPGTHDTAADQRCHGVCVQAQQISGRQRPSCRPISPR